MSKQRNALVLLFGFILVCLGISGCTRTGPYRSNLIEYEKIASLPLKCDGNSKAPCRVASIEKTEKYTLFFVELDEQGRFYDRRQIEALMDFLKNKQKLKAYTNVAAKCDDHESSFGDMSIVTFVHGWRHNAEYDDTNVRLAREILEFTANGEKLPPNPNPSRCARETVGVYLGWRGLSTTAGLNTKKSSILSTLLAPCELISVWDRKNTSQNMAVGSARELFSVLRAFQEDQNNDLTTKAKCNSPAHAQTSEGKNWENIFKIYHCKPVRLLIVGHSFGGLIAYNAVAGQLLDSVTRGALVEPKFDTCQDESAPPATSTPLPPTAMVRSYADLIILINPAVEGARYEALHQAVNYRAKIDPGGLGAFCPNQRPVLVTITSKYDWATGKTFPVVRFLSTLFESTNPKNPNFSPAERNYVSKEEYSTSTNTLGHVERFHTHRLNGAKQLIKPLNANEETDSYAKGLREYCSDAQSTTEIEKSLKRCRCDDKWNEPLKEVDSNKKLNEFAQICRAFVGEKNIAEMLASNILPWLMPIEKSLPNKFGSRARGWRQTFCGGATLTHLPVYKPSEGLKDQLRVENSVSSPVWNIYALDDTIIDGHSDIHKEVFKQFLQQLYHILTVKNFSRDNFEKFGEYAEENFIKGLNKNPCSEETLRVPR